MFAIQRGDGLFYSTRNMVDVGGVTQIVDGPSWSTIEYAHRYETEDAAQKTLNGIAKAFAHRGPFAITAVGE